jgi:MULE transposase domain
MYSSFPTVNHVALMLELCCKTKHTCAIHCRYGNVLGMDATYRTTLYNLPMFIINVVDNHGHGQPVAMFFVQEESGAAIAEMLQIFKELNPTFTPTYFMIDKSDMEMNGIREVYPGSEILLCDFHRYVCARTLFAAAFTCSQCLSHACCRLQAWWRWIVKNEHGVLAHRRQILFKALANLADAETLVQFDARLEGLKNDEDYVGNVALQVYLQREWLSCTEIWVACYRQVCKPFMNTDIHAITSADLDCLPIAGVPCWH